MIGIVAGLALGVVNLATFMLFGLDKAAATRGERRIPEAWLLNLALAGGSPGALLASRHYRHKTRKQPFRTILIAIACLQAVGLIVLAAGVYPIGP